MQQSEELVLRIPDLISLTPFQWDGCNPLYSSADRASTQWMVAHGVLSDSKHVQLDATNPDLLGAYVYPYADAKSLRIATDVLTILFALDEFTDDQGAQEASVTRDIFARALRGDSSDDTSPISTFTRE